MSETSFKQVNWIRVIAEGAAIVVSILLAFSIDAWWDGVKESRIQDGYLELLAGEFLEAKTELEADLEGRELIVSSSDSLLQWSARSATPPSDSMDVWLQWVGTYRRYQPPHAVYDNLVASGTTIGGVSDSLREALFTHDRMRDRYRLIEEVENRFRMETLGPYLQERTAKVRYAYDSDKRGLEELAKASAHDPILGDRKFQNLLLERSSYARGALEQGQQLLEVIEQILAMLPVSSVVR